MLEDSKVYIVSGCRTPIGNLGGQFERYTAAELGAIAIKEAIKRANIEAMDVEECIIGQVLTAGQGQNPARQAAHKAGIPFQTPAYTINMLCGSGLKAVALGYQSIRNNDTSIVVVGGQESMSRAQHSAYLRGQKYGDLNLCDTVLKDGLTDAFNNVHMGNTAEHLAVRYDLSGVSQDRYAYHSQSKTADAIKVGHFKKELVEVPSKNPKQSAPIVKDEFPRNNCTYESLANLKPVFQKETGTVTAGNSSGINDGAAALVLVSGREVRKRKLQPLAEIVAFAEVGVDPMVMGTGPIGAVNKVLSKCAWLKDEVDLFELNEAFAVQSIVCMNELELDEKKVNISGGAIALGHPIGASGARILVTLIHNLKRLNLKKGVAALCVGGGMGIAMAVEIF